MSNTGSNKLSRNTKENTPECTLSSNVNATRGSGGRIKVSTEQPKTDTCNGDLSALVDDIRQIKESLQETNLQLASVTATLAKYEHLEKCIKQRDNEIIELRGIVKQMQEVIDGQANHEVRNEVEIIGLPEVPNENLHHAVMMVASKIGVNLKDDDVDEVFRAGARRVKPADKPRPVVVRLVRHSKRKEIIRAAKQRKNISTTDITDGPAKPIFINERLTQKGRLLFRETREKSRKLGFRFCWTTEGNIFIRKAENAPAIRIKNEDDIRTFLETPTILLEKPSNQ